MASTAPYKELNGLEADLLYTPPRLRLAHIKRLGQLIPEIQPERLYAYEYIFHRITLFKPEADGDAVLPGELLHRQLGRLLRKLSHALPLNVRDEEEEVMLMPAVAAQCRVGLTTAKRWSVQGLPVSFYVLANGAHGWGVRRSALEQFLAVRRARPARESRRMTEEERRAILAEVHSLAGRNLSASVIAAKLAKSTGYSLSSIRRLLRQEGAAPEESASEQTGGLARQDLEEMVRLYRSGVAVQDLAGKFGRRPGTINRALHRALVKQALDVRIAYIPNPAFAAPEAEAVCLGGGGLFTDPPERTPSMTRAPVGVAPYLAELYDIPLLSREREKELFCKYNYIKYQAAMLQENIRRTGYRRALLERFEELRAAAEQVRLILIRCNLRLVVSIAKRHAGPLAQMTDLVSEGNVCLMRTVECYDFSREARFATYATWAVSKHFARVIPEENYRMAAFVTGQQAMIEAAGDAHASARDRSETVDHLRAILARATGQLDDRERTVIVSHYGTDGAPAKTLEEIGAVFGLTRERIRQIEARALAKLRTIIEPDAVESLA